MREELPTNGGSDRSASAVPLRRSERRKAAARTALGPQVVHEAIRREGEDELARPAKALLWSGVAAGLSMGFSLVAEGTLWASLPDVPWRPLVAKLGYAVGFLMVVLGRQQLFTENTLTVVLPFLAKPGRSGLAAVGRVWGVVLGANLLGALLFAWTLTATDLFSPAQRDAFALLAREAVEPSFFGLLGRAVYGGWLIAMMVWLLPAARSARFFVIVLLTWLVSAGGFAHAIAGSVEALYLVTSGAMGFDRFVLAFLLPVLLGNSLGGVALVAALNHAQVVAGHRAEA